MSDKPCYSITLPTCRKNKLLLAHIGGECYYLLGDWIDTLDHCGSGGV